MKMTVNGKTFEVREPIRKEKRALAIAYEGVFDLKRHAFDPEGTAKCIKLVEQFLLEGNEDHAVYDQAPSAQINDLREMARLVSEGLTGEERPD